MLLLKVDANNPDKAIIAQAGTILRQGGLVVFPTETVYGLGADATNLDAVAGIYQVKGRPSDNPLIWHANSLDDFKNVVKITPQAIKLAKAFWPGPLTMVLSKADGDTLAVRVPKHPVARAVIKASGCFIAAPSANISGRPSPTTAQHVACDFFNKNQIDMLIDGGATQNGLESTVVDLHTNTPKLLRPGSITLEMLREVLPDIEIYTPADFENAPLAPGMKYRHYAPSAPLILLVGSPDAVSHKITDYKSKLSNIGILRTYDIALEEVAKGLFDSLRKFDEDEVDTIIAEGVVEEGIGLAIMNRLKKAAVEVVYL